MTATLEPSPSATVAPTATPSPSPTASRTPTVTPTATPAHTTPDRIVIPAIKLDAPVETVGWHMEKEGTESVSVWDVPGRKAAGWLKTSAPAGQPGNTVLDGHNNILGEVFRRLEELKPGDAIDLYSGPVVYPYVVTEKHILPEKGQPASVRAANARWIAPTSDVRLTLVTCWPYTNNTYRLIIVAKPR